MSAASKTVLIIGSGGREHALAWKLSLSPRVGRVIVAPGNDGMFGPWFKREKVWERWPAQLGAGKPEFEKLARRALDEKVDLAVIGPDNPLADGIVDVFESRGLLTFGPRADAARIEASKAFAKEVMHAAGVPTARSFIAKDRQEALRFLRDADWNGWVVKADGLAFGKGVHVCGSLPEAIRAVEELPHGPLVIEERLSGEEISWMAFCDGESCALLEPARDHKRLLDGDQGPNTGGMGAYSPVAGVPPSWGERVREKVFLPTLREMKRRGTPFRGLLYAGLMVDFGRDALWVLEFNARFGDPETQVLLPRMDDDLYDWCEAVARGDLSGRPALVPFRKEAAVCVVAAARGYPDAPEKGAKISGTFVQSAPVNELAPPFFFAGVVEKENALFAAGGRVLAAVGTGRNFFEARQAAYDRLHHMSFSGMQFRRDIGGAI